MSCLYSLNKRNLGILATLGCPFSIHFRSKKRVRAQATLEFALILLPFFSLFFALIDYAQIYFYHNSLQNALRESARFATTGNIIETSPVVYEVDTNSGVTVPRAITDNEGREASRNECIRYTFLSNCVIQNIPLSSISIVSARVIGGAPPVTTTNSYGVLRLTGGFGTTTNNNIVTTNTSPTPAVAGPGGAGDYIQITAIYHIHTITPLFSYLGGYTREQVVGGYPIRVSAIVKNEPALLNFAHTNIYPDEPSNPAIQ